MNENVKKMALKALEDHLVMSLDQALLIGAELAKDSANGVDDVVIASLKTFKGALVGLMDKLDGMDNQP